ncbi:DUF1178 family protein [Pararhodobacter sp. CCB-MM2]|uniref:DUF1178 family protein n=1 Tax=Pararhodobacter sp. CCB-MM2 TaxID=1786003 RepID=UPI000836BCA4|nr:DUF1178 family protein [Pararhodobacter sp. CCB-MM2]MCA2012672.1 DUF1178 family protein [Cereibacter sphaeroides]
MIRYSLKCDQGHGFESWFASASAFDGLLKSGHLSCPHCGGTKVEKALMAPSVANGQPGPEADAPSPLAPQKGGIEEKIAALRKHVEANSDYVGQDFVREARAMHLGESPERAIWGEAKIDEARALAEEGVPVAPLPFMGKRQSN